jgi:DNA adenine methylase
MSQRQDDRRRNGVPRAEPFLRWAGGKRQLRKILLTFLPPNIDQRTYREPFLGGGSLFFAVQPTKAVLSDANEHLIRCYESVRDEPGLVSSYLRGHARNDSEAYYYQVRYKYNACRFSAAQAARFIYLNKACFNGIFRVNARGRFNVPYGRKKHPAIPSASELLSAAALLRNASLNASSFEKALEETSDGDFLYLDPPYPPLNGTAYFTHYTTGRFSVQDQQRLANYVHELDRSGCQFMISNADLPLIRRLYRRYELVSLPVIRYLTCKSVRHKVQELIITNYDVRNASETNALAVPSEAAPSEVKTT